MKRLDHLDFQRSCNCSTLSHPAFRTSPPWLIGGWLTSSPRVLSSQGPCCGARPQLWAALPGFFVCPSLPPARCRTWNSRSLLQFPVLPSVPGFSPTLTSSTRTNVMLFCVQLCVWVGKKTNWRIEVMQPIETSRDSIGDLQKTYWTSLKLVN